MLRIPEPGVAILLALWIANDLRREHGAPAVRVGLHHGPALERDGDYFGATGNLAARVSAHAPAAKCSRRHHRRAGPGLDGSSIASRLGAAALDNFRNSPD